MKKIYLLFTLIYMSTFVVAQEFEGFALYNELGEKTTYLVDKDGDIAHSWNNNVDCNYAVLLMENGNIMRGGINWGNIIFGAAVGGMVQEIDPDGNVVWEFIYSSEDYVSHHDITLMPDGGVMLIAWEVYEQDELEALGYTGNENELYPTHFVEVQHDGNGGGEIVWEWHMIDHMVQDVDSSLPNYGEIKDNPQLMDINVDVGGGGPGGWGGDWFHVNGINYNPELDQIVFSSRFLSEIFIIDHSTTTEEAAGHTGGNSGKGGDFLFRWGNPDNYDTPGQQKIAGPVHDARFIDNNGGPNDGFIQFFNNDGNGFKSLVQAINPEMDPDGYNYIKTDGEEYGPAEADWTHVAKKLVWGQSASNRLPNGNTYVNMSNEYMYEVDADDNLVWQYNAGPAKGFRYGCDHPGIIEILGDNPCNLSSVENLDEARVKLYPNPVKGKIQLSGELELFDQMMLRDVFGNVIYQGDMIEQMDVYNYTPGVYFLELLGDGQRLTKKFTIIY